MKFKHLAWAQKMLSFEDIPVARRTYREISQEWFDDVAATGLQCAGSNTGFCHASCRAARAGQPRLACNRRRRPRRGGNDSAAEEEIAAVWNFAIGGVHHMNHLTIASILAFVTTVLFLPLLANASSPVALPEPISLTLLATGVAGLGAAEMIRRLRK
jgi:hypothetical protein